MVCNHWLWVRQRNWLPMFSLGLSVSDDYYFYIANCRQFPWKITWFVSAWYFDQDPSQSFLQRPKYPPLPQPQSMECVWIPNTSHWYIGGWATPIFSLNLVVLDIGRAQNSSNSSNKGTFEYCALEVNVILVYLELILKYALWLQWNHSCVGIGFTQ